MTMNKEIISKMKMFPILLAVYQVSIPLLFANSILILIANSRWPNVIHLCHKTSFTFASDPVPAHEK
jgi:hypothetical protein